MMLYILAWYWRSCRIAEVNYAIKATNMRLEELWLNHTITFTSPNDGICNGQWFQAISQRDIAMYNKI